MLYSLWRSGIQMTGLVLPIQVDGGEKKVYFEVSDYGTNYIFYENFSG